MEAAMTVGVLGLGNMAEALVEGAIRGGLLVPERVLASRRQAAPLAAQGDRLGIQTTLDNAEVVQRADVVIAAVKPHLLLELLASLRGRWRRDQLLISVAAGITTGQIEGVLGEVPVVRTMPNTPCLVGEGASAYALGAYARTRDGDFTARLLETVGLAIEVPEAQIDAVTGVSGSGPAYIFYLLEGLYAAGQAVGLEPEVARRLADQTVLGAARMVTSSGEDPSVLRGKVTSPGGTTEAAIGVLEAHDLHGAIRAAVIRARDRGQELGRSS